MALFHINRYLGDEEEESTNECQSKALLAKLQKQVKFREQSKSSPNVPKSKPFVQSDSEVLKNKRKPEIQETAHNKKKKQKHGDQVVPDTHAGSLEHGDTSDDRKNTTNEKAIKEGAKKKPPIDRGRRNKGQESPAADGGAVEHEEESSKDGSMAESPKDLATLNSSSHPGFTVLGGFENKTVQKVPMVLPQWLAQPDSIQRDIKKNLIPVCEVPGICPRLRERLKSNGIQHFFPVQAQVIPAILESVCHGLLVGRGGYRPRDICVSAPTGSGKTLAFVIPIVQALLERVVCHVRVLAVLPTKELAQQVCKVFCSYAEGTNLKVVMLVGQKSFATEQTLLSENRGGVSCSLADIVVATPGRLVDHINKNAGFSLAHLRFLVIDEADRMIDSMHQSWLSQVTSAVYKAQRGSAVASIFSRTQPVSITAASVSTPQMPLQKLLFSATLTQNPEKLQQLGLHQPRLFSSVHSCSSTLSTSNANSSSPASSKSQERFNFPQGLTEYYVPCTLSKKPLLILHFILRLKFSPVLCFTNSRETAHRLYLLVQLFGGVQAAEFSSRLSPNERKRTLKDFEQGKIQLLICTDAASRGIDINGVKCVVNYDAPQFIRAYIHRVGRTARAGKAGLAFTFLLGVQEKNFLQMVKEAGSPGIQKQIIKPESLKSMESRYQQILLELGKAIKDEKAKKNL